MEKLLYTSQVGMDTVNFLQLCADLVRISRLRTRWAKLLTHFSLAHLLNNQISFSYSWNFLTLLVIWFRQLFFRAWKRMNSRTLKGLDINCKLNRFLKLCIFSVAYENWHPLFGRLYILSDAILHSSVYLWVMCALKWGGRWNERIVSLIRYRYFFRVDIDWRAFLSNWAHLLTKGYIGEFAKQYSSFVFSVASQFGFRCWNIEFTYRSESLNFEVQAEAFTFFERDATVNTVAYGIFAQILLLVEGVVQRKCMANSDWLIWQLGGRKRSSFAWGVRQWPFLFVCILPGAE